MHCVSAYRQSNVNILEVPIDLGIKECGKNGHVQHSTTLIGVLYFNSAKLLRVLKIEQTNNSFCHYVIIDISVFYS